MALLESAGAIVLRSVGPSSCDHGRGITVVIPKRRCVSPEDHLRRAIPVEMGFRSGSRGVSGLEFV